MTIFDRTEALMTVCPNPVTELALFVETFLFPGILWNDEWSDDVAFWLIDPDQSTWQPPVTR